MSANLSRPTAVAALIAASLFAPLWLSAQPAPSPSLSTADAAAIVAAARAAPELPLPRDLTVAALATTLAEDEHGVIRDPRAIDSDWALRAPYDAGADFAAAQREGRVAAWATSLPRRDPDYLGLVAERRRYQAIVARGGWKALGPGADLKLGATGARVSALRARLAAEGFVPTESTASDVFDAALAAAVADFQKHHRTPPDGVLDTRTRQALDVPAESRLTAIEASLERARWLPRVLPANRIEVDLAGAHATLFQNGAPVLTMRAIVGAVKHKTPLFQSDVVAVVFNPPWVVPTSIARAELFPKERRSPGYFARNGFHLADGQLIQSAGPKASLGLIKFDMTDPFGVYLHDTPARTLFAQHHRALSHGCMRLQAPRDLAAALLALQGWSRADVEAAIATGATRRVPLKAPFPVFVVYRTAEIAADGRARFRRDVYGWDARLAEAMGIR